MTFESKNIEAIYASKVARKYDFKMPPFFLKWKKLAFEDSALKSGDRVLVFCCGTGLDFPYILDKIGPGGQIVGVDFSAEMLRSARLKIEEHGWENVELIEADITKYKGAGDKKYDVGVCTLGLSIIPDYRQGYRNLVSSVKRQGEIIIGDMQLASGWRARLNPVTIMAAKKFGGTREGHQNSIEVRAMMEQELTDVRQREFFFKAYYYCIGRTK
jgi:ubiquinone/menaquinone biosynthesis C-methylase UbiE